MGRPTNIGLVRQRFYTGGVLRGRSGPVEEPPLDASCSRNGQSEAGTSNWAVDAVGDNWGDDGLALN